MELTGSKFSQVWEGRFMMGRARGSFGPLLTFKKSCIKRLDVWSAWLYLCKAGNTAKPNISGEGKYTPPQ